MQVMLKVVRSDNVVHRYKSSYGIPVEKHIVISVLDRVLREWKKFKTTKFDQ